jgi:hypothetical protein
VCLWSRSRLILKAFILSTDSGFDTQDLRLVCEKREIETNIARNPHSVTERNCFDEELYKRRMVIEHANAW